MDSEKNLSKPRNSFTSSIGFVLAAAGSAVGLGNIWRFPYLAAKDGGGIFLFIYLILAVTFGFAMLITEVAIGRKTQESPLTAYKKLNSKWSFLGFFSFIVPFIIYPYYCVIGGWVMKYMFTYLAFLGEVTTEEGFFTGFITSQWQPILYTVIFALCCFIIVYKGVERGIERYSKILMPILFLIVVFIAIYSLTLKHTDADGVTRTGLQGASIYFIPNFKGLTFSKLLYIIVDALGQLFYSLSISMGIMVAYGSYMKKENNLGKSVNQIEIFDTGIAILAGMMIIPAVFAFSGTDGMSAGPGLIFITLPKVFLSLGKFGTFIGLIFFVMVMFAAITSAVSILEAIVSSMIDRLHWSRKKAVLVMSSVAFVISIVVCLGYNKFYFEYNLPNGAVAQILDIFDYVSNNILMPVVGLLTCLLIGWVVKPKTIVDEITRNGEHFARKTLYIIMIKFLCPVLLFVILLASFGIFR
ncbi:NSS family neurotransmitter:Na+ symporter [Treponema rectale]|uniref:NSS family neurotransmitter:Na+ symporter n=1 Tax=Treponema rectale TaxID=744512 RepID=A0A840S802_9SPIR|nr:sodium-dependent transporter [Treponema rectale]MBB5218749.1 NSS family neurotransmitter:Na+ symporter [Treponema rectale]